MKDKLIKEKISEILESERKSHKFNSNLQREHSLSLSYPEGKIAYFKQRIFELKQQIADETMIGRAWCENWYNYDAIDINWMQKLTVILLKPKYKMNENEVWEQLQRFFKQFLQLLDYEFIIKEYESERKNEKPYKCLRRVYSFILAEAYHKGHLKIKNMPKTAFKDYVTGLFKNPKVATEVYQTVRSSYKLESNFLNFYSEMQKKHSKDYDYAMKNYKNYFPDNLESESK